MTLSETDYAWAAGFLDGEGHFYIRMNGTSLGWGLRAANTFKPPIVKLHKMFGGKTYLRPAKGTHSVAHEWQLTGPRILPILCRLQPYLLVKAAEAATMLELAPKYAAAEDAVERHLLIRIYNKRMVGLRKLGKIRLHEVVSPAETVSVE